MSGRQSSIPPSLQNSIHSLTLEAGVQRGSAASLVSLAFALEVPKVSVASPASAPFVEGAVAAVAALGLAF